MHTTPSSASGGTDAGLLDLVPGEPPVPITVWRTPAADTDVHPLIPATLVRQLVAAYTRPGQQILDLTGGLLTDAADDRTITRADLGAGIIRSEQAAPPAQSLSMIAACWPLPGTRRGTLGDATATLLGSAAEWLAPGGVLVLLAANPPGSPPVDYGPFVAAADTAGLGYLQHIAAVRTVVDGDRITAPAQPSDYSFGGAVDATVVHLPVHADVFVFAARTGGRHA